MALPVDEFEVLANPAELAAGAPEAGSEAQRGVRRGGVVGIQAVQGEVGARRKLLCAGAAQGRNTFNLKAKFESGLAFLSFFCFRS